MSTKDINLAKTTRGGNAVNDCAQMPAELSANQTEVFLQPGEYFVGNASHRIRTILGSCVSVTLWDPVKRIGAMSHFLLAGRNNVEGGTDETRLDAKYGDEAMHLMLRELARHKVKPAQCQAKVFGGGNMFPLYKNDNAYNVGRRNGEAAHALLRAYGIEVISESLFGLGHRNIVFDVGLGHVWSRQVLPCSHAVLAANGLVP